MRQLTQMGVPFSFSHATYDFQRQCTNGIRTVPRAMLRPAAANDDIMHASHKLFYFDENELPRNCWQILLMYFNGKRVYI